MSESSSVCVRFDRHALYLGTPGTDQICPSQSAGRTEAILISPQNASPSAAAARGPLTPPSGTGISADSMLTLVKRTDRVVITATWNRSPETIRHALGLSSLAAAAIATTGHAPKRAGIVGRQAAGRAHAAITASTPATPGQIYSGLGFDACSAPSASTLSAWSASPYRALGIYIGGANIACTQSNLTASWVSLESAAGWHMIPTYVGLQAPTTGCSSCAKINAATASSEGTAAALDAVTQAQALGIGPGNPIYDDMENYTQTAVSTAAVLAFLEAWTTQLHTSGYLSGVYSSAASGISDLVAAASTGYTEPDDVWIAHWDDDPTTADSYVPAGDWANNQRLRQYEGANNETYGGVEMNVDDDDLDGATAAYGTTAPLTAVASVPTLSVSPRADGNVQLASNWDGETGIAQWEFLGGPSATAMTAIATVPYATTPLISDDAYPYYEVEALSATGQVIGSSQPVQTPASDAIFGNSIFASTKGTIGLPVRCVNVSPCEIHGAIFDGSRRLTHILGQYVPDSGGVIKFPVTTGLLRALQGVTEQEVRVDLVTSSGRKVTRKLELHPFKISGPAPIRQIGASATLRIQSKTEFVSNGWVGGVLATCTARTTCMLTTKVTTRAGALISYVKSQTLGSGQTGYLTFTLTNHGHALLKADLDNQLAARVLVTSTPAAISNGAAGIQVATKATTAKATVSLVSYR